VVRASAVSAATARARVTDSRYVSQRINAGRWLPYAQSLVTACTHDPAGDITLNAWGGHKFTVACARIRR
jgi:hypothetical protein